MLFQRDGHFARYSARLRGNDDIILALLRVKSARALRLSCYFAVATKARNSGTSNEPNG